MLLEIFPSSETVRDLYKNHGHFHKGDSGLDLFCVSNETINPGETVIVDLGIRCSLKQFEWCPYLWFKNRSFYKYNSYLLLPRSSISKTPLLMKNSIGLIDAEYTGSLKFPVVNISNTVYNIRRGDRLVQLVRSDLKQINFCLTNRVRKTSRGEGGFGST
jgi:dUTP pyrophosphatase